MAISTAVAALLCDRNLRQPNGFAKGTLGVRCNGKCGFIRRDGTWLAAPEFNEVHGFDNGRAYARVGREWVIVDSSGRINKQA